jgi:dTDP-4-dehydrorhamnose reductase
MNILVTGCNGQLGSEIRLLQNANKQYNWFNTDVNDLDITDNKAVNEYVNSKSIDGIINCAAFTDVNKAESNVTLCKLLNTEAPAILAAAIEKRHGWLIQISTDYVFNGTNFKPYTENDIPSPNSVYGNTKLNGELAIKKLCKKVLIIRTAWLYSTFGNNYVKTMIRLGKERKELGVVFDQIGTPTYAHDLALAIVAIINKGVTAGLYHFSNEGVISWYDFTKAIHRIAGITSCLVKPIHTEDYPTPANRPHYSVLDKTKIKNAFNIEIPYWETSLEKCIKKILANE